METIRIDRIFADDADRDFLLDEVGAEFGFSL
jgi:hypothetical protein